jgi:hypothetical protein
LNIQAFNMSSPPLHTFKILKIMCWNKWCPVIVVFITRKMTYNKKIILIKGNLHVKNNVMWMLTCWHVNIIGKIWKHLLYLIMDWTTHKEGIPCLWLCFLHKWVIERRMLCYKIWSHSKSNPKFDDYSYEWLHKCLLTFI